ncbi:AMP-binding protein [Candidatus Magnetaquicoccus inordinatus]|uniref:AMP-binding protein n=1 Tax=Candidatus Magnetaquicoccus inordinatus TaxID=2496818 RepID=UPI00102B2B29|nr:AMP-binding protein [Candidatus Magnetaquicoccus inordinatus]
MTLPSPFLVDLPTKLPATANPAWWFHRNALLQPERPALFVQDTLYRYQELLDYLLPLAQTLLQEDPQPEHPIVALFASRSLTAYASVLAIHYAGKGYAALNPLFPAERNRHILNLTDAILLIADASCIEQLAELLTQCEKSRIVLLPDQQTLPACCQKLTQHRFLCHSEIFAHRSLLQEPLQVEQQLAYLLFTSGSTGIPKGIAVPASSLNVFIANMLLRYHPTPEDRFSQHSDLTFDASVYDQFLCWAAGASLYCLPHSIRYAPAPFIRQHALTFWESVPSVVHFMKRMHQLKAGAFPSLRWSVFGGERLNLETVHLWQQAAPHSGIDNSYGPTESTICITGYIWRPGHSEAECLEGMVPIGLPYPGQQVAILREGVLYQEEEDVVGELCLSGSQVDTYYWRNESETNRRYFCLNDDHGNPQRWYKTGDRVYWQQGVGLYYLDRMDRQLKIRGYRVELAEIEQVLQQVAQSDQVAVVGWTKPGTQVATIIGFVAHTQATHAALLAGCSDRLPPYMVPNTLHTLEELPRNANGKTDLQQLLAILDGEA